jgi:hypothetical protein
MPRRTAGGAPSRTDAELLASRFHPGIRGEVRRQMRMSPRLADLARSFPGLLYAIASGYGSGEARREGVALVIAGAPMKQVAATLDVPLWLRRLPPEAFCGPLDAVARSESFARRIVNCLPASTSESPLWLESVCFASTAVHEDFAIWLAGQQVFAEPADPERLFAVLAVYAWFSGQPFKAAHNLMIVPWRPEISLETALCAAKSWLNRVRLVVQLRPGIIDDPWLQGGEVGNLQFVPLLTASELLEEAQTMHNCADQYADRIARDRCRLFGVRRKGGARVATMEVAQHQREQGFLEIAQLKARHNMPAPLEVWQAAHLWMGSQRGLRRAAPAVLPTRPLDNACWAQLLAPYREAKGGAPWLASHLTLNALAALDSDLAELARRAGVTSWLFT